MSAHSLTLGCRRASTPFASPDPLLLLPEWRSERERERRSNQDWWLEQRAKSRGCERMTREILKKRSSLTPSHRLELIITSFRSLFCFPFLFSCPSQSSSRLPHSQPRQVAHQQEPPDTLSCLSFSSRKCVRSAACLLTSFPHTLLQAREAVLPDLRSEGEGCETGRTSASSERKMLTRCVEVPWGMDP